MRELTDRIDLKQDALELKYVVNLSLANNKEIFPVIYHYELNSRWEYTSVLYNVCLLVVAVLCGGETSCGKKYTIPFKPEIFLCGFSPTILDANKYYSNWFENSL